MTTEPPDLGVAGSDGFVRAVAGFLSLAGLALAAVRFAGSLPAERGPEAALGAFAMGAPVVATGVLALLALRGRAALLLPAAVVLVPMSFLSFALVTLPLLVPAGMLAVGHQRRSRLEPPPGAPAAAIVAVVVVLLVAALAALLVHQDPREYVTATGTSATSDVITAVEALISLALTSATVVAGWFLAAPRRTAPRPAHSAGS